MQKQKILPVFIFSFLFLGSVQAASLGKTDSLADESSEEATRLLQKTMKLASEDKAFEKKIYKESGLNPSGGLGGMMPRRRYVYDGFRAIAYLRLNWDEFREWWRMNHWNLTDTAEKRRTRWFSSLDIAGAISRFKGPNAILDWRKQEQAIAMGSIAAQSLREQEQVKSQFAKERLLANWEWWDNFLKVGPDRFKDIFMTKEFGSVEKKEVVNSEEGFMSPEFVAKKKKQTEKGSLPPWVWGYEKMVDSRRKRDDLVAI